MKRALAWIVLPLVSLAIVLVLVVALFDWNVLKAPVAELASERLDREVRILGDLDVDLGMTTRVRARGVQIANAPWALPEPFLAVDAIELAVDLGAALKGRIALPSVVIENPRLRLARSADGEVNWAFALGGETGGGLPVVRELEVLGGEVSYRDPALDEPIHVSLERVRGELTADETLALVGTATVEGMPARVKLDARPVAPGEGWRADATIRLGGAKLVLSGTLGEPDLRLALDADDLSQLDVPPLSRAAARPRRARAECPESVARRTRRVVSMSAPSSDRRPAPRRGVPIHPSRHR